MNRSILLVICDFFILTLLSFVTFDTTSPGRTPAADTEPTPPSSQVSAPAMSNMLATLESALLLEKQQRDTLTNELALSNAELERRIRLLAEREQRLTNAQERLQQSEAEARRLAEERARLDLARAEALARAQTLQQAFESTRQNTDTLQDRLVDSTREAEAAKARLKVIEEELTQRREEAREMQQRLTKLDQATETLRNDKEKLLVDLRQTESDARVARFEVTNLSKQLVVVSEEKAQLAQTTAVLATNLGTLNTTLTNNVSALATNVSALAEQSTAIQERIDRQTRLPANTIYGDFLSNRVETAMSATTRGGLGQEVVRDRNGATVLVRRGANVFAALHVESTALRFWPPDAPWSGFSLHLDRKTTRIEAREFALVRRDPRIVLVPVTEAEASGLGVRIYEAASDPSQFAEAVIVGAEERYYGETAYRLNAERPGYVEMERSTFRRILGEFAPRKGDLAFTKTGLLLGILVNGDQCLLLESLETLPPFRCGPGSNAAQNTQILRTAFGILEKQPAALR